MHCLHLCFKLSQGLSWHIRSSSEDRLYLIWSPGRAQRFRNTWCQKPGGQACPLFAFTVGMANTAAADSQKKFSAFTSYWRAQEDQAVFTVLAASFHSSVFLVLCIPLGAPWLTGSPHQKRKHRKWSPGFWKWVQELSRVCWRLFSCPCHPWDAHPPWDGAGHKTHYFWPAFMISGG